MWIVAVVRFFNKRCNKKSNITYYNQLVIINIHFLILKTKNALLVGKQNDRLKKKKRKKHKLEDRNERFRIE